MDVAIKLLVGGAFVLAGLGIFGLQIFWFLQSGSWTPMSLIDLVKQISQEPWLYDPKQWVGVHWLLDKIPSSLLVMLLGYGIVVAED